MCNRAEICKAFPATALVAVLIFSPLVAAYTISIGHANPYSPAGDVPPRGDTIPPKISVFYPKNDSAYKVSYFVLNFTVSAPTGPDVDSPDIAEIYYKTDWGQ